MLTASIINKEAIVAFAQARENQTEYAEPRVFNTRHQIHVDQEIEDSDLQTHIEEFLPRFIAAMIANLVRNIPKDVEFLQLERSEAVDCATDSYSSIHMRTCIAVGFFADEFDAKGNPIRYREAKILRIEVLYRQC